MAQNGYSSPPGKVDLRSDSFDGTRFQVLSDLHLEVQGLYETFSIPPAAKYLILCGDVGNLRHKDRVLGFLAAQASKFERVFLVLGNHEFYGIHNSGRRLGNSELVGSAT
jgi:Calcineurin-like phosphoesterase